MEFLKTNWRRAGLDSLLKKIWGAGSTDHRHESSRLKHTRAEDNVTAVNELIGLLSQEDQTQTHRSTCQIAKDMVWSNTV